jgi:hypothetical protein
VSYLINTVDMGGETGTYREKEAQLGLWWGNVKNRYHFGNQGINGRIILHLFLQDTKLEGVDCANLT